MKNFYKEMIFAVVLVLVYFFVLPSLLGWYFAPEKVAPKLEIRKMSCELEKPCRL